MANSLDSNVTRQLARVFLPAFDAARVITKSINTQLLDGKFSPSSGANVDFKRPHDYTTYRDADGDLTSYTKPDIVSGKATGTVQDYFTSATEWTNLEEAIQLDQLDQILAPMATRLCQDMESDVAQYMAENAGGSYAASGTIGTAVTTWTDVAKTGAYLEALGVPKDKKWCYTSDPFTAVGLAGASADNGGQINRASGSDKLVDDAYHNATIANDFAGFRVLRSTHLHTITGVTYSDGAGAINDASVSSTYASVKDSLTRTLTVDSFGTETFAANALKGHVVTITGRNMLSHATRNSLLVDGSTRTYTGVIVSNTAFTSGAGTITVAGAPVYEANGAYNSIDAALADNDVVTISNVSATNYTPNLAYHPDAFSVGTVKLPKLYSTDTVATTKDGMSIRVSKYSDGDTNKQKVRFDLLPAYAVLNPWFSTHAWG